MGKRKEIKFRRKLVVSPEADLESAEDIIALLIARAYAADNPHLFQAQNSEGRDGDSSAEDKNIKDCR